MNIKKLLIIISCAILLVVVLRFTIFKPHNQGLYKVTILPSLGGDFTLPLSINDKGQIAGFSEVSRGNYHLFLWYKENGMQDLDIVANRDIFINNTGQIAANVSDPNRNEKVFIWDPNTGRTILPSLGGKITYVLGINNHGQIVGTSEISTGINHAFIWDAVNGMRDLTPEDTGRTGVFCINDAGQIVISSKNSIVFVSKNKNSEYEYTPIPVIGIIQMNNNGYVIGMVQTVQNKFDIVTWHKNSGSKSIFQSDTGSSSYEINDANQIIITGGMENIKFLGKYLYTTKSKNYLLDPNLGRISLDGYVPVGRHENLCLVDINNDGCIIGAIQSTKDSKSVGVLFEPIPEKWEKKNKNKKSHK